MVTPILSEDEIVAMMAKIEDDRVAGLYPKIKGVPFPDDAPDMHWVDVTDLPDVAVGWTLDEAGGFAPPPPPSLEERRRTLLDGVRSERRRRIDAGFEFNEKHFATDLRGQSDINFAAGQLLYDAKSAVFLPTLEGDVVELNADSFIEFMSALIEYRDAVHRTAKEHTRDIKASDDPENYDIRSGWPHGPLDDEEHDDATDR